MPSSDLLRENPKLLDANIAHKNRRILKLQNRKLTLTNGCFDILHPGHLIYLKQAATLGDALWVGLNSDASVRTLKGTTRPIFNEHERAYALGALEYVDNVFIFSGTHLAQEIRDLYPDRYAKAGDYTLDTLNPNERAALEAIGAEIHFMPFIQGYSTTQLIERVKGYEISLKKANQEHTNRLPT